MKLLTLVAVLTAFACSKKDTPAPDPKPVDPAANAPKPPEPKPEPVLPETTKAEPVAAGCTVQIKITADKVSYDGGGVKGDVAYKPGASIDLAALKPAVGKCNANVWAEDKIAYQDVINVMDATTKVGITDVGIGSPTDTRTEPAKPPKPTAPSGWTMTTTTSPDGKLTITGHMDPNAPKDKLLGMPILIMTKTDVQLAGKTIAKVSDEELIDKVAKALPPNPKNPTLILQADRELPFSTIAAAVKAAQASGYDNLLFAVKNK